MRPNNPPEMEKLLMKYHNGGVPPLVAEDGEDNLGLLKRELLDIFQKGSSATYSIPICISPISDDHIARTRNSDAPLLSCNIIQSIIKENEDKDIEQEEQDATSESDFECCDHCPVELKLTDGKAQPYMCDVGMVGFAVPVYVAGEVVAVLSSHCRKPCEGLVWPEQLPGLEVTDLSDGVESPMDLWAESKRRIEKSERLLEFAPGGILEAVNRTVEADPEFEISSESLLSIADALENAGAHLSEMANKTYKLEKDSVVGWLRAEMASALSSVETFWDIIQWCLKDLTELMGIDYLLLISRDKSSASSFKLQCHCGLPDESLPVVQYDWTGSANRVQDFVEKLSAFKDVTEIDLRQYRDVPILGMLYSIYGKGISYPVLIAPTITLDGGLTFMVLGRRKFAAKRVPMSQGESGGEPSASKSNWLREDDRQYMMTIVRELAIIISVYFSMKRLQDTVEEQTNLMESVAHDLKTPIQNIMIAAENLREGRVDPERASRTIAGVVTQLQRLDMLAQKTWMLERIRLDKLEYNDGQMVNSYQIFKECRELLTDMAERSSIDIHIDPNIEDWRDVRADVEMFRLAILNLLHNGIKYSFPNTRVKIGGWQDKVGADVSISVENEGIQIHDEERDHIFDRYFRSKDAISMDPAGSGIGLALVKEFIDHYSGRIDVRSTEVGFGKYLNVFSLFLPGG